jgi:serine/threonine-protein kinase
MSDEMLGREVGRYKILELIGKGGMATVYKAFDTRLDREVAIKFIRSEVFPVAELDMLHKRFEREAKSLGRLSHPNIVPVIDYGEFEGVPYLVMIYVSGGTLRDRLGELIPWRNAVQTLLPIAHALEYVHDQDIINRDIKPSNILLTENGEPLLTDFGLVKIYGEKAKNITNITVSGAGLGTPNYMAPEQWIGGATAQSDLYSLGVVLYEMITGHCPYVADTPAEILLKQNSEPLPLPTDYVPDLPGDVEAVMLKVLAKDPENRYPDIHVFVSELKKLLTGEKVTASSVGVEQLRAQMTGTEIPPTSTPKPPASTPHKKTKSPLSTILMLFGVLALVAAIGGGGWFLYTTFGPSTTPVIVTVLVPPTASTETSIPADTQTPEITIPPDTTPTSEFSDVPMIKIPSGEFTMGRYVPPKDERKNEAPAHEVFLDDYSIDEYEVTNGDYKECVEAGVCEVPYILNASTSASAKEYYSDPDYADFPVIFVDWFMANEYCEWRGARLPTEAEWEKAARGSNNEHFPWGGQDTLSCAFARYGACGRDTVAVGSHPAGVSPFGVHDMAGNVWEWVADWYGSDYYASSPSDNPQGPAVGNYRVARGGCVEQQFNATMGDLPD